MVLLFLQNNFAVAILLLLDTKCIRLNVDEGLLSGLVVIQAAPEHLELTRFGT
jgi:hypothetical protein